MSLKAPLSTPLIVALWLITLSLTSLQGQLWASPAGETGLSSRALQQLRNAERLWDQRRFSEAAQLYLDLYEDEQIGDHLLRAAQGQASAGQKIKAFRLYQRFIEEHPNHQGYRSAEARLEALRGELRGSFQKVRVESDPAGAYVYIDRRGGGTFGETPLDVDLLPGAYMVITEREGYLPQQKRLVVTEGGSQQRVKLSLLSLDEAGYLRFLIPQARARVRVDGLEVGRSPLRKPIPVRAGRHLIEVSRSGFMNWSQEVEVQLNQTQLVDVELRQEMLASTASERKTRLWPWVTVGTGGVLLLAGLYTGVSAQSLHDKLGEKRDRGELIARSDIEVGQSFVLYTNLLMGVGVATLSGGLLWYFLGGDDQRAPPSAQERVFAPASLSVSPDGSTHFLLRGQF